MEELFDLVRKIPEGRVAAYSALGRSLERPVSGLIVGRWMARAPEGVPWWRVVAADGSMPVYKRDLLFEQEQARRLEEEGITLVEGKAPREAFVDVDAL